MKKSIFIVSNAFSLNMLSTHQLYSLEDILIQHITTEDAKAIFKNYNTTLDETLSLVGHKELVPFIQKELGTDKIEFNRITFKLDLQQYDMVRMLIAQYSGDRLSEGATSLPDDAKISWFLVGFNL